MAEQSGYFDDGTDAVELGATTYATPTVSRKLTRLQPHSRTASVHDLGGGIQEIEVTGGRKRYNLGDAERYAYELFSTLATSDPGELGIRNVRHENGAAYTQIWSDAVCVDAQATVEAYRWVSLDLRFLAPSEPPTTTTTSATTTTTNGVHWPAPDPPGEYSGTSTDQNYAAGGTDLGVGGSMDLEMVRTADLRTIPRARGAVTGAPWSAADIRFTINAHIRGNIQHLASRLEELARSIGARPVDLTGNGNTFSNVVLDGLDPDHTQLRSTAFTAEFIQEL